MSEQIKFAENLAVADLEAFPVWQFLYEDEKGESAVRPVRHTPVENLKGCLVGTQVQLKNGVRLWALIGNVSSNDPRRTQQFLTLSIFRNGRLFHLARYFDFDFNEHGPHELARFLGLRIDEIFPISYDLTPLSLGDSRALKGTIDVDPPERLTRAERIAMSVQ
jgi:hypothetical protein